MLNDASGGSSWISVKTYGHWFNLIMKKTSKFRKIRRKNIIFRTN